MATELKLAIGEAGTWDCCRPCSLRTRGGCVFVQNNNGNETSVRQSLVLIQNLVFTIELAAKGWIESHIANDARIYLDIMSENSCNLIKL